MGLTFPPAHVLVFLALAQAQTARPVPPATPLTEIPTRLEALLVSPSIVVVADYYPIDMRFGPGLALDAVVVTDADKQARQRGLRIQISEDGRPNGRTEASFMDFEDVVRLSRALQTMTDLALKYSGQDSQRATDLSFATPGGFRVAIHETGRVVRVIVSTGLLEPVGISLSVPDLLTLKQAVDSAIAILNVK